MTDITATSSFPSKNDKPVIVGVKRKAYQSHLEAFLKELKTKKVFVQHVETVSSPKVSSDVLQSFVPKSVDEFGSKETNEERRHTFENENKQDQLLVKAKQKQEALSKNSRFEQIWRSRKEREEATHDDALHEICHVYNVVCVDVEETASEVQEQENTDLEDDHKIMSSYLPLLRKFIPSADAEIESDIHDYMSNQEDKDTGSRTLSDELEELGSATASDKYSEPEDLEHNWSEHANTFCEDVAYCYDGGGDDDWRWSYS
ncbi:RNA-directed DNA methylation 4 [Camellia lanceoleosa]|uniref:RNA-directed DNA methylation 4 n=1 Tax=Camellia lanceoleosa TaxID=1840588 RepID=A0ACC0HRH7_9ERIC|nr:RNA-directed DNA methylation 4 [Camellia lanceoleosa]